MSETMIERIVRLIKEKGVNEKTFCNAIGVAQSTFTNWKTRGTDPKSAYLKLTSEFLGVSERYLLTGEENDEHEFSELEGVYLSLAKEARENQIDPEDIRLAIQMIKQIRAEETKS